MTQYEDVQFSEVRNQEIKPSQLGNIQVYIIIPELIGETYIEFSIFVGDSQVPLTNRLQLNIDVKPYEDME